MVWVTRLELATSCTPFMNTTKIHKNITIYLTMKPSYFNAVIILLKISIKTKQYINIYVVGKMSSQCRQEKLLYIIVEIFKNKIK